MTVWWDPRTWLASERVTSPLLNKYIRDAFRSTWHEITYVEFTANVVATSGGTDVVTAGAITYLAYPTIIELSAPGIDNGVKLQLFDTAAATPNLGDLTVSPSYVNPDVRAFRKLTPTPGSHTFKVVAVGATGNVYAGAGGSGIRFPGYLRILQRGPV